LIVRRVAPLFLTVTFLAALVLPITCVGKTSFNGERLRKVWEAILLIKAADAPFDDG
jgi:ABC-type spermidine/putrescine transport system permease subunit II